MVGNFIFIVAGMILDLVFFVLNSVQVLVIPHEALDALAWGIGKFAVARGWINMPDLVGAVSFILKVYMVKYSIKIAMWLLSHIPYFGNGGPLPSFSYSSVDSSVDTSRRQYATVIGYQNKGKELKMFPVHKKLTEGKNTGRQGRLFKRR